MLDSLALLVLLEAPRRYQKANWTLDDLDQSMLAEAILEGFGIRSATASAAADAIAGATSGGGCWSMAGEARS